MRRPKKTCPITEAGIRFVDYKDERFLARFITENGKILPSRLSGVDARHQRQRHPRLQRGFHQMPEHGVNSLELL